MRWIEEDDFSSSVFWMYGPAGAGKSAIAQTLAELIRASGRNGASFFFSRGKIGRDQVPPIYNLCPPINIQMQIFIVEPLAEVNGSLHSVPINIIDMDECHGHDAQ